MNFDPETLQLSSALSRAAFLVVFLTIALRQPRDLCIWHWIGAILTSMIGSSVMAGVPVSRWLTSGEALIIYTCYAASLTLSWSGLRLFNERNVRLYLVALMTLLPGLVYLIGMSAGLPMRIALTAIVLLCGVYAAIGAFEAISRSSDQRLWSAYIVAATLGTYALSLAATLALLVFSELPMNSADSATISMIVDQASGILVYFGYIAMAKEKAVLAVQTISETDPLTGLVNRRGLQAALSRYRSKLDSQQLSGIFLADIDHFKSINDTHGHEAGDAVLTAFAQRIRNSLRKDDVVARWGGEEFLAVLPQLNGKTLAVIVERLRRAIEAEPFALPNGMTINLTVSIGVSEMPRGESEFEPATKRADEALYEAKRTGRNKVCSAPFDTFIQSTCGIQPQTSKLSSGYALQ